MHFDIGHMLHGHMDTTHMHHHTGHTNYGGIYKGVNTNQAQSNHQQDTSHYEDDLHLMSREPTHQQLPLPLPHQQLPLFESADNFPDDSQTILGLTEYQQPLPLPHQQLPLPMGTAAHALLSEPVDTSQPDVSAHGSDSAAPPQAQTGSHDGHQRHQQTEHKKSHRDDSTAAKMAAHIANEEELRRQDEMRDEAGRPTPTSTSTSAPSPAIRHRQPQSQTQPRHHHRTTTRPTAPRRPQAADLLCRDFSYGLSLASLWLINQDYSGEFTLGGQSLSGENLPHTLGYIALGLSLIYAMGTALKNDMSVIPLTGYSGCR